MSDMFKHRDLDERYIERVIATAALAGAVIVTSHGQNSMWPSLYKIANGGGEGWFGSRFEAAQAFLAQHDIEVK